MSKPLLAKRHEFDDYPQLLEYFYQQRWTDGHPIVPPTETIVQKFLDYARLEPDAVIADFPVRNRRVTAEALAINSVMAGCRPEYMPIVVAGVKAMAHPDFEFNHIACLQSTYPHFIISGPIVNELEINHGIWAWGAGDRATSTLSRAFSLILWNLLKQEPRGVQRGSFGQPGRWGNCIAENPESPWTGLNVTEGFGKDVSTITCVSLYSIFGQQSPYVMLPDVVLDMMLALVFTAEWRRGVYLVQVQPMLAKTLAEQGWTKERVRQYLLDNASATVAELKRRGIYGKHTEGEFVGDKVAMDFLKVKPGDETTRIYLFKDNGPLEKLAFGSAIDNLSNKGRKDVMLVVNGGDSGASFAWRGAHKATSPVTMAIERPQP